MTIGSVWSLDAARVQKHLERIEECLAALEVVSEGYKELIGQLESKTGRYELALRLIIEQPERAVEVAHAALTSPEARP